MRINHYLILLCFLFPCFLGAQDSLKKKPFVKLYALNGQLGFWVYDSKDYLTKADYDKIVPASTIGQLVSGDYKDRFYPLEIPGPNIALRTCLLFYNKTKKEYNNRYELKIGLAFQNKLQDGISFKKEEKVRFDTLTGSQSGEQLFVDTVKTTEINYAMNYNIYSLDLFFTTHSKQNRILSCYTGMYTGIGYVPSRDLEIDYNHFEYFSDQNGNSYPYQEGPNDYVRAQENYKLKGGSVVIIAPAIGGLVRFSKSRKGSVSRFALNLDMKIGMKIEQMPNKVTRTTFFSLNYGIKYFFQREPINRSYRPPQPFY